MDDKKTFSQIGLTMLIATALINIVQYWAMLIAKNIPAISSNVDLYFLVCMLPMYAIAYPIVFAQFKKIPVQLTGEKKKMPTRHLVKASVMCYAISMVFNLLGSVVTGIIGAMKQDAVENVVVNITSNVGPATNFLFFVICAPIFEELLFRKAIISRISKYGDGIALVFSALIFGLFHGNLLQGGYAFIMGLFFGYVFIKTGKIIYSIVMHMFVNFVGSFVGPFLMNITNYAEYQVKLAELTASGASPEALNAFMMENMSGVLLVGLWGFVVIILVIAGIILFLKNRKKFVLASGEITIEKSKRFSTIYVNVGMILYAAFWIGMIVWQLLA